MILVCGEALIDILVSPDSPTDAIKASFGGAPFNVALGLSRLGVPSAFCGGLSSDPAGTALLSKLKSESVDTRFVRVSGLPNMLALAGISPSGTASYSFPIVDGADKQLPVLSAVLSDSGQIDCAVFGSYLAAHRETGPPLVQLARQLRSTALICFDPNVRPALQHEPEYWKDGLESFLPVIDVLKASDEDIRHIYGEDADIPLIADEWLSRGVSAVFVTQGAAGASVYTRAADGLSFPAPVTEVIDTVGAGDSFLAGLLCYFHHAKCLSNAGLANTLHLRQATEFAILAAAHTCRRHGADMPNLDDLETEAHRFGMKSCHV